MPHDDVPAALIFSICTLFTFLLFMTRSRMHFTKKTGTNQDTIGQANSQKAALSLLLFCCFFVAHSVGTLPALSEVANRQSATYARLRWPS